MPKDEDLRDVIDVLQSVLSTEPLNESTRGAIQGCVNVLSMQEPQSNGDEPISASISRHYRRAARENGALFVWCVQNLEKFPPITIDWMEDVRRRLLKGREAA